ncbi:hypothetical protein BP422_16070 [Brevibacillus formosus]|uniref:ABC transporter permease n=1 Tax=Brevibacillus formosus TaxID=54913 RepID=A0A220MIT1_9BACL|nr:ABC transporter permease [Brevibacillus formosus]ASJ54947.1 hypothetical protein BP422_16070 [Brevibacillus formosus]
MSWKMCWRNLMRKKLRTFFTIIAMIASVAIVLAVCSSVDSTKKLIEKQMQESEGNANYVLESNNNTMSSEYLSKVRQVKGVSDAFASLYVYTQFTIPERSELNETNNRIRITGLSSTNNSMRKLVAKDGDINQSGAIIPEVAANIWKVKIGDIIALDTPTGKKEIAISAIVANGGFFESPSNWEAAQGKRWRIVIPLATLQSWYQLEDQVSEIRVKTATTGEQIESDIRTTIQDNRIALRPVVLDGKQTNQVDAIYQILYLIGGLITLISGFIVFNTFYISIGERKKEFAIMKALGYIPSQIVKSIMTEVCLFSLIGLLFGIPIGIQLAEVLKKLLFTSFKASYNVSIELQFAILMAALIGIMIPILAACFPMYQASRTSIMFMIKSAMGPQIGSKQRWRSYIGFLLILLSFFTKTFFGVFLFMGAVFLFPSILNIICKGFAKINNRIWGFGGFVATQSISRHINRTANASFILSIGIVCTIFVTSAIETGNHYAQDIIQTTSGGDMNVRLDKVITDSDIKTIQQLSGVNSVAMYNEEKVSWKTQNQLQRQFPVISINEDWAKQHPLFRSQEYSNAQLLEKLSKAYTILLGRRSFEEWGGKIGDKIMINTWKGEQSFEVVGVVDTSFILKYKGYLAFCSDSHFQDHFGTKDAKNILLTYTNSSYERNIKEEILKNFGGQINELTTVHSDLDRMKQSLSSTPFYALLSLVILISGIGIVNTLMMNVMERTREIGTMRSLGFTNSQTTKMILSEGLMIGITGVLSGIFLGFITIYLYTKTINLDIEPVIPWSTIAAVSILGILTSFIAALLPSRRATKLPLIESLKYE